MVQQGVIWSSISDQTGSTIQGGMYYSRAIRMQCRHALGRAGRHRPQTNLASLQPSKPKPNPQTCGAPAARQGPRRDGCPGAATARCVTTPLPDPMRLLLALPAWLPSSAAAAATVGTPVPTSAGTAAAADAAAAPALACAACAPRPRGENASSHAAAAATAIATPPAQTPAMAAGASSGFGPPRAASGPLVAPDVKTSTGSWEAPDACTKSRGCAPAGAVCDAGCGGDTAASGCGAIASLSGAAVEAGVVGGSAPFGCDMLLAGLSGCSVGAVTEPPAEELGCAWAGCGAAAWLPGSGEVPTAPPDPEPCCWLPPCCGVPVAAELPAPPPADELEGGGVAPNHTRAAGPPTRASRYGWSFRGGASARPATSKS